MTTETGIPVAGICVSLHDPMDDHSGGVRYYGPPDAFGAVGRTDKDGNYLARVNWYGPGSAGETWSVGFWDCRDDPVYADVSFDFPAPSAGVVRGMDAHLSEGGRIAGRVLDPAGQPAANVYVAVYNGSHKDGLTQWAFPEHMVATDANGYFLLKGLTSGAQRLSFNLCPANGFEMETCPGSPYEPEWYKDQPNIGSYGGYDRAETVSVTPMATTDIGTVAVAFGPTPTPSASAS